MIIQPDIRLIPQDNLAGKPKLRRTKAFLTVTMLITVGVLFVVGCVSLYGKTDSPDEVSVEDIISHLR